MRPSVIIVACITAKVLACMAVAANKPAGDDIVTMEKVIVEATREQPFGVKPRVWLHTAIPGYEVLSLCGYDTT